MVAVGEEKLPVSVPIFAVTAAVGAVLLLLILLCSIGKKEQERKREPAEETKKPAASVDERSSKKPRVVAKPKKSSQLAFSHPWLSTCLKSHSSQVLDLHFSSNGKYLISVAEDRTAVLWSVKELNHRGNKFVRTNIEFDYATHVQFSPDTKAFVVSLANMNSLRIFRIGKKDNGSPGKIVATFDFPKMHTADIINIGVACNGRFIMTCSNDTTIIVWNIKGEVLTTIDTHQIHNSHGAVSNCGRFIASSGFTADVKVWEVCFDKAGTFKEVSRAFELKGHNAGVQDFSFNSDSSRMVSVSKDGTWKFWDTDVQYKMQQEPYLLHTGNLKTKLPQSVTLSPDGRTAVVVCKNILSFYNTQTGEEEESIGNLSSGSIKVMSFDNSGKYMVCTNDRHLLVFHNVTGYRALIKDLEEKHKKPASQGVKDRIQQQMQDARATLQQILNSERI